MPVTKSAKKRVLTNEKRHQRNKSIRSRCRTNVVKVGRLISAGDLEGARAAATVAISSLDRAADKGVIHTNSAARRKARLVKKLNQAAVN